jgi:transcriptional antiterminator RfaH
LSKNSGLVSSEKRLRSSIWAISAIVSGWWNARWAAGVRRLVMDGLVPARVPDRVITEIRSRERGGLIELPKLRLEPGMRVKVLQGPLQDQIGLLAALRPHERVLVLLQLLGGQQRVDLARSSIEAIEQRS